MTTLDALKLAHDLQARLVDFTSSECFVRDRTLEKHLRDLWSADDGNGLVGRPWVEAAFGARRSKETLAKLGEEGLLTAALVEQLDRAGAFKKNWELYEHQLAAVRATAQKSSAPALIVTAGTGAGKTESFLFPVLNALFSTTPQNRRGMRALLLYPMNALVNDQVDRLYGWLRGQSTVSLFHFTSETPETRRDADNQGVPRWQACRRRTREEARKDVPDIVVTNYSMLEYMLCRPQDAVFFGDDLEAIVLDEAHLYTGTLAAEITLLLRRVLARCGKKPEDVLQIATSATIGSGAVGELAAFAATVFSKPPALVVPIIGSQETFETGKSDPPLEPEAADRVAGLQLSRPLIVLRQRGAEEGEAKPELLVDAAECARLAKVCSLLVGPNSIDAAQAIAKEAPARFLHAALRHAPLVRKLLSVLDDRKRCTLDELARHLWDGDSPTSMEATIRLLQLGASARTTVDALPLVPHRLHLLLRPADGASLCVCASCDAPFSLDEGTRVGRVHTGSPVRCSCGGLTLPIARCGSCGFWALAAEEQAGSLVPSVRGSLWIEAGSRLFSVVPVEGAKTLLVDERTGERRGHGAAGRQLWELESPRAATNDDGSGPLPACPNCRSEDWLNIVTHDGRTLGVAAETIVARVPELPTGQTAALPARGRRLLAFSDSRQDAARLGPRLMAQHEILLVRSSLVDVMSAPRSTPETAAATLASIRALEAAVALMAPEVRGPTEEALQRMRATLPSSNEPLDLRSWAKKIIETGRADELLDHDTAGSHRWPWTQKHWDENRTRTRDRMAALIAGELARPWRPGTALEALGLLEVVYPKLEKLAPPAAVAALPTTRLRDALSTCWHDLLADLCDSIRIEGCLTLEGLADEDDVSDVQSPLGTWCAKSARAGRYLLPFVGATPAHRRRRLLANVFAALGTDGPDRIGEGAEVEAILGAAFDQLLEGARQQELAWLQGELRRDGDGESWAIRIKLDALLLRRPERLFRCKRTGHVWARSVREAAPSTGCDRLAPVTPEELDEDPRIGRRRRELRESDLFRLALWAEEHTAQLDPRENRRLQDLFKAGARNVLSSTTTLELGIDIGGLQAVFLANVPPGKANYLQRGGRAGRRADGSSIVVTYSRPRPFDREVFHRFGDYLDRPLRSPRVLLERERIGRRHAHAYLLGSYFATLERGYAGAMDAFGKMGPFCGAVPIPDWEHTQSNHPGASLKAAFESEGTLSDGVLEYLRKSVGDDDIRAAMLRLLEHTGASEIVDDWTSFLASARERFNKARNAWLEDYTALFQLWKGAKSRPEARRFAYDLQELARTTVIEWFANSQFLPRYGFPIDVLKLMVNVPDGRRARSSVVDTRFRLDRAGILAIREYVPGSQLLAGGQLLTSRGLLKHWTGANVDHPFGLKGHYARCTADHLTYWTGQAPADCSVCGAPFASRPRDLCFPTHGFQTAAWDPPRRSVDTERVGKASLATMTFVASDPSILQETVRFARIEGLCARYTEAGRVLSYNEGDEELGFAICTRCGYAESERRLGSSRVNLPPGFERHAPLLQPNRFPQCWPDDQAPVLRNQALAAETPTDVFQVDFSRFVGHVAPEEQTPILTTLGYALQGAGARLLGLDTREIGCLLSGASGGVITPVLFDNVPGGAGHVRELYDAGRTLLAEAQDRLRGTPDHDARCERACLDCLLTFDTQSAMTAGHLRRRAALGILDGLLGGTAVAAPDVAHTSKGSGEGKASDEAERSRVERLLTKTRNTTKPRRG